jgi:hypothetical protein
MHSPKYTINFEEDMARPKKASAAGYTAPVETPAVDTLPVPVEKAATQNAPKRKGKAPSKKTLIVRAGIAEHPKLKPKALAELLNSKHPGFDIKNGDISQQKLQLGNLGKKAGKKKTSKTTAEKTAANEPIKLKASPAKAGSEITLVADLAKRIGTPKIRELCDLIDYLA